MVMDPNILSQGTAEEQPKSEVGEAFVAAADRLITDGKNKVRERFEESPDPENNLEYHKTEHTEAVIQRNDEILEAIEADEHQRTLGKIAAAHHDIVQNWEEVEGIRRRTIGQNERDSAAWAIREMRRTSDEAGEEIFTREDMRIVEEAILATVPDFKGGAVIQPNLTTESHPVAVALALADLGEAGMSGPEGFIRGSDNHFREDHMGMAKDLEEMRETGEPLNAETKEHHHREMLSWSKGQLGFIGARERLFETDIAALPDGKKDAVRRLFNRFGETAERIRDTVARREKMTFEELAADMGYEPATSD